MRTAREAWVEEGLRALAAGGPEAVRVEPLARALGVTKGGFYWHFSDRSALLAEILERWEQLVVDDVIARVDARGGDARSRLLDLFMSATRIGDVFKVELSIRDWARRDGDVARRVRRVDNRRMEYMRSLFRDLCDDDDDVEARCVLAMTLFAGFHLLRADHGGRTRRDALELATRHLLA